MDEKMIDFSYKREIGITQTKIDSRVDIAGLQKVLSITGEAMILSSESISGETRFNGELCLEIIYIDNENSTKSIRNLTSFDGKIENSGINSLLKPILRADIVDISGEQSGENRLDITTIVETNMYGFITESIKEFSNENCVTKSEPITLMEVITSGEARINLEEEFTLRERAGEILSINAQLLPKNYQGGTGYIQIDAYLIVEVVYSVNREDKTEIRSDFLRRDIKEEIEVEKVSRDNHIILSANIRNCSVENTVNGQQVTLSIPLDINYIVLSECTKNIVVDAFSEKNEVNITYDSIAQIDKVQNYTTTERIEGEIVIGGNETRINRILASDGVRVVLTSVVAGDRILKIEGITYKNIIYQSDDDNGTILSVNAEIPFALQLDIPSLKSDDIVSIKCVIIDSSDKLKKGRIIEIDNELGINVNIVSEHFESVLKEVSLLDEVHTTDSNFMIYFAHAGDTLWDICKELRVSDEQIILQNKDITFPLVSDTTIVIYRKAERK